MYLLNHDFLTALAMVLLVGSMLLQPCLAAPARHHKKSNHYWWHDSCDNNSDPKNSNTTHERLQRHKEKCPSGDFVPKPLKSMVRTALKIFSSELNKEYKKAEKLYGQVGSFKNIQRDTENYLPEYKKRKSNKTNLMVFHSEFQNYAVAIHHLQHLEVNVIGTFDLKSRNHILQTIADHMKQLLCEFEMAVNKTCQSVPERIPPSRFVKAREQYDQTTMLLEDSWILTRFQRFTHNWLKNLGRLLPNESDSDESKEKSWNISADGE